MGQYYHVVNTDKKQMLHPHKFDDGLKLGEFGAGGSYCSTMYALSLLLANSNNRGGGDHRSNNPLIGSWAGDRIVIAGDYAEKTDPGEQGDEILYGREDIEDISEQMLLVIAEDPYGREAVQRHLDGYLMSTLSPETAAKLKTT
ncbi:MAG: hypothetical protein ACR2QF_03105 [Geminicoccaceae bacterium]